MTPIMRDAQHKLSKRDGDAYYEDFLAKGYLKEAIVNYVALLGWNPGDEREFFTMEELIRAFSVEDEQIPRDFRREQAHMDECGIYPPPQPR